MLTIGYPFNMPYKIIRGVFQRPRLKIRPSPKCPRTFPKMPRDLPQTPWRPFPSCRPLRPTHALHPLMLGLSPSCPFSPFHPEHRHLFHPEPPHPVILSAAKDLREAVPIAGSGRQPGTLNVCTPYPLERVMRLH